ncbi:hypothetical protein DPMN_061959 [Dreissena polymorpha]|uniref:Uncharacterized protein n=1 Tax=Dreissena polymorpha TaxID=45954 RepID=A0A9D4C8V1_DREPO|nr:hypothetical protein DPMN_061959 [Dreissena polymorpha]
MLNHYHALLNEIDSRFRVIETPRTFATRFSRRSRRSCKILEEFAADQKDSMTRHKVDETGEQETKI